MERVDFLIDLYFDWERKKLNRKRRINKEKDMKAPKIIIDNEQRVYDDLDKLQGLFLWANDCEIVDKVIEDYLTGKIIPIFDDEGFCVNFKRLHSKDTPEERLIKAIFGEDYKKRTKD